MPLEFSDGPTKSYSGSIFAFVDAPEGYEIVVIGARLLTFLIKTSPCIIILMGYPAPVNQPLENRSLQN